MPNLVVVLLRKTRSGKLILLNQLQTNRGTLPLSFVRCFEAEIGFSKQYEFWQMSHAGQKRFLLRA
jgi:hypothetical protein